MAIYGSNVILTILLIVKNEFEKLFYLTLLRFVLL